MIPIRPWLFLVFALFVACSNGNPAGAQAPSTAAQSSSAKSAPTKSAPTKSAVEETDFSAELPKIPPRSPEESLRAIRVHDGFHIELVASEPLIRSPMGMDFDEFGRAFIVELPEYNQYASSEPHGQGAIKRLEDTDGDGRYDRATVYVDNLNYPTAVACWDGGVVVGVAPDLLFCKDTDGDGKADIRRRMYTGFGQDKAGEGMLNSIRWRIDNRFHISTGLDGGEVVPASDATPAAEKAASAPVRAINARNQHLLLDPRRMALEATGGGGQHGMSLDDWSLRTFVCGNSEPAHLVMYDSRYLARNPYLEAPAAAIDITPDGKFTKLMRISAVEPWRVLRTRLRSQGAIPGSDEGGQASGFFTGATGITVYRGDAFPAEYRGQLFVGEVANNLVYRARLEPNGVGLSAVRADTAAEFMASADNWFRPVQFANAPDGTLYVLDMYRELIEGAAFLVPQILKHMDTSAGSQMGRIYRIAPDGFRFEAPPRLGDMGTAELVKYYEHANAWQRDTASRLIYHRQDAAAVEPLRQMALQSPSPLARTMALYSLQGLGALEPELVLAALRQGPSPARQHAMRLAESFPAVPALEAEVVRLAASDDVTIRYQAAFSLGAFPSHQATATLAKLGVRDGADKWMELAVLSSVSSRRGEFLALLLADPAERELPHVRALLGATAAQVGAANDKSEIAALLRQIEELAGLAEARPVAVSLVRSLVGKQASVRELLRGTAGTHTQEIVARILRDALATAQDDRAKPAARAAAVRSLAAADFAEVQPLFTELLQSRQPQPVQAAALETLARFDNPDVPQMIVAMWPAQTPQLRATSIETLFSRAAWLPVILDALENQLIAPADLDAPHAALLRDHRDAAIRTRAAKLLASSALAHRQAVVDAYQPALEKAGDVERGRTVFRKNCSACHRLENYGEAIGAELSAIRDRGLAAVMLNILDPNREVKPQFLNYVVVLDSGRALSGMIKAETANSLTIRKADNTDETVLRVNIEELASTGISFMPEGLEKQVDVAAMADLLAYLNSIK